MMSEFARGVIGCTWLDVLEAFVPSTRGRLDEMRLMLVANGLFHWTQLGKVKDVMSLAGVENLTDEELKALRELQHNGRQAPQSPRCARAVTWQAHAIVQGVSAGRVDCVPANLEVSSTAKGKGPLAAAKSLKLEALSPIERAQWVETARFAFSS
jgi:hypothetical protein